MKHLIYIVIFLLASISSIAQSISVSGSWSASVSSTAVTEAGNDYASGYFVESNTNQTQINITAGIGVTIPSGWAGFFCQLFGNCPSGPKPWVVNVSKSDVNWDSRLVLALKRTGTSSGVTLGTTYMNLSSASQTFFKGTDNTSNIPIQYKLSGISVLIPTGTYSTNVVYTVMDQ